MEYESGAPLNHVARLPPKWSIVVFRRKYKYIHMHVALHVGQVNRWWIYLWNQKECVSYQSRYNYAKTFEDPRVAMTRALKIAKRIYRENKDEE